ncbi:hypothetical protein [Paenibacillus sp. OV219]|nr:hypothetical protein [Paenibacillus sp. OV219]SEN20287.1 hypothetical protein SAMN05518847_102404 [Paenibacillus sp. OV219]
MFGILKDLVNDTLKSVKVVDDAVTDVYKDVKKEYGLDHESLRNLIKGK